MITAALNLQLLALRWRFTWIYNPSL